jgi:hypothetical protein
MIDVDKKLCSEIRREIYYIIEDYFMGTLLVNQIWNEIGPIIGQPQKTEQRHDGPLPMIHDELVSGIHEETI